MSQEISNLQKKKITSEIEKAVNHGFSIDTDNDEEFLKNETYSWDDLNSLKEDLGNSVLDFVGQVNSIITNKDIIINLKDKKDHFNKLIEIFFSDINEFSGKVKKLREEHDNMSGHINNINEFNVYNRIAINYHALYTELTTLVSPTISELILTIAEIVTPNSPQTIEGTVVEEVKNVH